MHIKDIRERNTSAKFTEKYKNQIENFLFAITNTFNTSQYALKTFNQLINTCVNQNSLQKTPKVASELLINTFIKIKVYTITF